MFIGIVGTECAGKALVKRYLTAHGFADLSLPDAEDAHPSTTPTTFPTPSAMLAHATRHWHAHFVTTSLTAHADLAQCIKRPFFLLLLVDAPVLLRWRRLRAKRPALAEGQEALDAFLARNDQLVYGPPGATGCDFPRVPQPLADRTPCPSPGAASLHTLARSLTHVSVLNGFATIPELHAHLDALDLLDPERLRPGWDSYFMVTHLASLRSNCMKRRVGALLVRSHRVISTGYNGTPRGLVNCAEGGCARCNGSGARSGEMLDECLCLHAEENALLEAGRERVSGGGGGGGGGAAEGAVLYCNTCPCLRCSVKIVQTGVREVVYNLAYSMDEASAKVFKEAGVALRQHCPPP
ncbi:hypothetical protein CALCODRAFT_533680 [Calocera cornea HHB12733]|uniref:Deoxycytidylate deaminase n=1 Tax=Calocera cornea HHB12733 TaxID=1353952 RepID=A0A165K2Z8_9BASI|nr:hypothetical protein CALCODRAFT_533680 [Calocera cornea HHB12733]